MITSPLMRYHGGKFRLAPWVIKHFPLVSEYSTYVEPYGGAAGVLIQKERSYAEVYNDLDGDVVNLFRVLRDPRMCQRLVDAVALTPYARNEFEIAYKPTRNRVERARRLLVRASMGFGSAGATKGQTGFRIDSHRVYGTAQHIWTRLPPNIVAVADRLTGVLIENRDAIRVMNDHDAPRTLHFVDPPYLPETRAGGNRYYRHEMTVEQHQELLTSVRQLEGYVVICGYPSDLYNDYLNDWQRVETTSRISANRGTALRTECIWLSPRVTEHQRQSDLFIAS